MKESTIRTQILTYLNSLPNSHFLINRPGAQSGEADITGCINGRRCEFEVKKMGYKGRKLQLYKLGLWKEAKAITAVVHSVLETQQVLFAFGILKNEEEPHEPLP